MPPGSRAPRSGSAVIRGRPPRRGHQIRGDGANAKPLEHMASVSRSGGLGIDGDALKSAKVQKDYRDFIQEKLVAFWTAFPVEGTRSHSRGRVDAQENLLILFRKLREGLVSSNRRDAFAVEAYETSFYLSLIFSSPRHTSSIISQLTPSLYQLLPIPPAHPLPATILLLLYHLLSIYPSQTVFHDRLHELPVTHLPHDSATRKWLLSLAKALRTLNYVQFDTLSRAQSCTPFISSSQGPPPTHPDLPAIAMQTVLAALRAKARERTWIILRSAYRELWCHEGSETRMWLHRCLSLDGEEYDAESWLKGREEEGHIKSKEGADGRWIVCRIK